MSGLMIPAPVSESPSQDPSATETSLPVTVKFLGMPCTHTPIRAHVREVSPKGLSVELQASTNHGISLHSEGEDNIKLIPFLILNEKLVDLTITIPPTDGCVRAVDRLVWYDLGSKGQTYYFMARVFLEDMKTDDKKKWEEYLRNYERSRK